MKLSRCNDQPGTLEEFYGAMIENGASESDIGGTMLRLIERLKALPDERSVWGLTSHYTLCLLSENSSASHWYVKVVAIGRNYFVEYRMPDALAPWPEAYVKGEARSEAEAVHMLLEGMLNSGGWVAQHARDA